MKRILLALLMTLLCVTNAHSKVTYLHSNPMGSIVAATNEAGQQLWVKRYTPFGIESEASGTVADSGANHGYATHEVDKETGLVYMKARYYDPLVGKILSTDPVGFQEAQYWSFNPYMYSANNPFSYADPSGLTIEIGSVAVIPWYAQHTGVIVTPSYPVELMISRPDIYLSIAMSGGSMALDAHNISGSLSPRGFDPNYPWGNLQQVYPENSAYSYTFGGFGSQLSADTTSIINMMDAYSYLSIQDNKQAYNGWGSGHINDAWDTGFHYIMPSFYNGGWNSNNFSTSILDAGGVNYNQDMFPSSPGFGTPLPDMNW